MPSPIAINYAGPLYTLFDASTATGAESNHLFRGEYTNHQLQVSTAGATAQNFIVYTSNDCSVWTAIRDQNDVDNSVASYSGSTASGVIQLSGCYPWLKIVSGTAVAGAFTASIYSNNWRDS
jgi:hypothetical protein